MINFLEKISTKFAGFCRSWIWNKLCCR